MIPDVSHDVGALDVPVETDAERFYHGVLCSVFPQKPSSNLDREAVKLMAVFSMVKGALVETVEEARYYSADGLASYVLKTRRSLPRDGSVNKVDYWAAVDSAVDRMLEMSK